MNGANTVEIDALQIQERYQNFYYSGYLVAICIDVMCNFRTISKNIHGALHENLNEFFCESAAVF